MSAQLARRIWIGVLVATVVAAAVLLAMHIPRTISIFLVAAFIAFGAAPLVMRLEQKMPRPAAIAVVYLGLLGALVLLALVIVPVSYAQLLVLVNHASDYVDASETGVAQLEQFVRAHVGPHVQLPTYGQVQAEVGSRVGGLFSDTLASLGTILVSTLNAFLIGASALILSVFFLARGREVRRGLLGLVPAKRRAKTNALLVEVASIFGHFVAGQLALCAIVGAAVWVALAPAHFAFSLLVAVICAVGYAVPFFGMIVAQLLALALAISQGPTMAIYVTVSIFVIARIADSVLVPKIMADAVGVSPIGVMFAVFAGGELFGMWGLILGIPAAALVRVLFTYFVLPWLVRLQLAEHGLDDEGLEPVYPPVDDAVVDVVMTPAVAPTSIPVR
jgi:predicted PurR-regulated permease PerM